MIVVAAGIPGPPPRAPRPRPPTAVPHSRHQSWPGARPVPHDGHGRSGAATGVVSGVSTPMRLTSPLQPYRVARDLGDLCEHAVGVVGGHGEQTEALEHADVADRL